MKFTIEIASTPDRDHLAAEIWMNDATVAEVRRSAGGFVIEIYPQASGTPLNFDLQDWMNTLTEAQRRLG